MDIKIIGIDIDGTLLNSEGILTEATVAALQRAADRGIQVAFCTGASVQNFPSSSFNCPWCATPSPVPGRRSWT